MTMNSWRTKIDRDSFELFKRSYDSFLIAGRSQGNHGYYSGSMEEDSAPNMVYADGRLFKHLMELA